MATQTDLGQVAHHTVMSSCLVFVCVEVLQPSQPNGVMPSEGQFT